MKTYCIVCKKTLKINPKVFKIKNWKFDIKVSLFSRNNKKSRLLIA